uniref:Uncharacterized protein n=1 Tax=Astyanax mexicanus TaxID=7994 RepID=A0A3B1K0S2_ASTMX
LTLSLIDFLIPADLELAWSPSLPETKTPKKTKIPNRYCNSNFHRKKFVNLLFIISVFRLNNNNIAEDGCAALSSALYSNPSHLIDLDLSENKLGNSGVKQLCFFLNTTDCKLQQLKLSFCSITEEGYGALASAIKSNPSSLLNEMDLRGNDPGETGVELLINLQNDAASKLKKIR